MGEPYYEDDFATIYHGDCLELLPEVLGPEVGLVIADPPYNVGIEYGDGTDDERVDYAAWCRSWFDLLRSVPVIAITPGIANIGCWYGIEPPTWVMAWNKPASMGRCTIGFNNWEPVLLWGRPRKPTADAFSAPLVPDGALAGHPCPKPLRWGTQLVSRLSDEGATVLDPFAGSGTTLRAAKDLGRRSIGIEVEERYCEIAANRLSQEVFDFGVA